MFEHAPISRKEERKMKQSLERMLPVAEAVAKLLHPFAEVVVHDLESDTIAALFNPFSQRQPGDESYIKGREYLTAATEKIIGPYDKTNWDGRPLKSITIVIKDDAGNNEGFLCINMDVSAFKNFEHVIQSFLFNGNLGRDDKAAMFGNDLYEKTNVFVQDYCQKNHVTIETLSRDQKKELIGLLEAEGAFEGKNAATYIARVLNVSRATVYNYLKKIAA